MRAKLRTPSPKAAPPRVDREEGHGVIRGCSLISKGPALGHGFEIDDETLDQAAALAEGVPGRWTHGSLCGDGLGTHLGRWRNVRRDGDRVLGDFHFSASASRVQPEGLSVDAPTYLMDLAESEPDVAGVSVVIDFDLEEVPVEPTDDEPEPAARLVARLTALSRADYVADPAANPAGLFSGTPSELAEQATARATALLSEAEDTYGRARTRAFVTAFLSAYLSESEDPVKLKRDAKKKVAAALAAAASQDDEDEKGPEAEMAEGDEESEDDDEEKGGAMSKLARENADLKARLSALEREAKAKALAEDKAWLESIQREAANELQAPLSAAKISKLQAHLKAGRRDVARELGDAYLEAARASGQRPFRQVPAAPQGALSSHEETVRRGKLRAEARHLERLARARAATDADIARLAAINTELAAEAAHNGR